MLIEDVFSRRILHKSAFLIFDRNGVDGFAGRGLSHLPACRIALGDSGFLFSALTLKEVLFRGLR